MQRSFTIWSFLTALAVCAAGCDTGGSSVKQDETERAKYESQVQKGSAPTGMPGMGGAAGTAPKDYPGAEEHSQGGTTQPSGSELEKLYKKKGG